MADRFYGTIEILKSDIRRYPELAAAVKSEFFWDMKDEELDIDKHIPGNCDNWEESSPIAYFADEEAAYGEFEEIEDICQALHVPYNRWNAAKYEFAEATVYYRPDVDEGKEIYCGGESGEREFTESELRKLVSYNTVVLDDLTGPTVDIKATGRKFMDFLDSLPKIHPLEDYEGYVHEETKS
jgi:hypothetical protein